MDNLTKIICTIGPSCESKPVLKKMLAAGMDCVRLNFSHGTYAQFGRIIKNIRELSRESGREVAVIADLQGPKIRIGDLDEKGVAVAKGEKVVLSVRPNRSEEAPLMRPKGATFMPNRSKEALKMRSQGAIFNKEKNTIPVQYRLLAHDVKKGDVILIDDGMIELEVAAVNAQKTKIECVVATGGVIKNHKGINVPTASISAPPLTAKDKKDLRFGLENGIDYVGLSFVKNAKNIWDLRRLMERMEQAAGRKKSRPKIIAKIERHEAIENMEEIIRAADAVMVARGDLGVETPAECVPLYQKKIIHLCNSHGKPVIVATQMLDSMIENPRPTRAEISDAATAIFDHADAFMLSNETAAGKFPVEATLTLQKVASAVEKDLKTHQHLLRLWRPEDMPLTNAACLNACKLAGDIHAKFIVAITKTGYTATEIAKYRPFVPMIVFTPAVAVQRQMTLVWGVAKTFVKKIDLKNPLPQIIRVLLAAKIVKAGDEIVVCNAGLKKEKLIMTAKV